MVKNEMMYDKKELAERLLQVREHFGLSQYELAISLGYEDDTYIRKLEKSQVEVRSIFLDKLVRKYGVSTDWLLYGELHMLDLISKEYLEWLDIKNDKYLMKDMNFMYKYLLTNKLSEKNFHFGFEKILSAYMAIDFGNDTAVDEYLLTKGWKPSKFIQKLLKTYDIFIDGIERKIDYINDTIKAGNNRHQIKEINCLLRKQKDTKKLIMHNIHLLSDYKKYYKDDLTQIGVWFNDLGEKEKHRARYLYEKNKKEKKEQKAGR